jgi:[CysO sulfur-carrier protein]-S-L-cysteine hydrolase
MNLLLPESIVERIKTALLTAGHREVGGVLMGEHVGVDIFRVTDLTIQMKGGSFAAFVRIVDLIVAPLRAFFQATNHDYTRFNYLGEWHSHHSFALVPSSRDHLTMQEIVLDPAVGARFAVLLLVKLSEKRELECSATVYTPTALPASGHAMFE